MRLYCANNNTIYSSVAEAARALNINRSSIHRQLNGERQTAANYVFAKLDDVRPDKVRTARAFLLFNAFGILLDTDEPIYFNESG